MVLDELVVEERRSALEHEWEGHFDESPAIYARDGVGQAGRLAPNVVGDDDALEELAGVALLYLSEIARLAQVRAHEGARLAPQEGLNGQRDELVVVEGRPGLARVQLLGRQVEGLGARPLVERLPGVPSGHGCCWLTPLGFLASAFGASLCFVPFVHFPLAPKFAQASAYLQTGTQVNSELADVWVGLVIISGCEL